jgi:magnesium-transporting ATPase (P-type)
MLALDNTVTKQGVELHSKLDLVEEHLFDSTLKRMAVVYEKEGRRLRCLHERRCRSGV